MIDGYRELSHSERLKKLKLPSLQYRRRRADMLPTFRIVNGIDNLDEGKFFKRSQERRTRGHGLWFKKKAIISVARGKVFSQRFVNEWNSLPDGVISRATVNQFKNRLWEWWKDDPEKYMDYLPPTVRRPTEAASFAL
ncbi:hypothetical protein Pmani_000225 [Petrolisthes manimaculis]|uniref:Uncharacterized protein n=1 Tax=Petrolisthes manimaculis TaxID=1843537 RepID=A0AAE1QMX6_9EUCA|nr:hypothetical protein Pmani_000225 [Petrolisthes manimaculis]